MRTNVVASLWQRLACEASRASLAQKATQLQDACGALATRRCISRTRVSVMFFTCQKHTPAEGFDVAAIGRPS